MLAAMPSPTSPVGAHRDETPVRDRGDACPGALRLHAADDGRLARLRLPGGLLTARQATVLAEAAERLGDGHLDITSRGNVQLRGLAEACAAPLAATLHDAGLLPSERHERARNIVASPLAGEDEHPFADVRLWVAELDALVCASAAAASLSGRFLFALDDGRGDVAALGADVTLLAEAARGGTAVLCVGRDRLRVRAADAPRAALLAAETFLTSAAGTGAWRVRELPDGHGLSARLATALAAAGVAAEPVRGGPDLPRGAAPALGVITAPGRGRSAVSVQPRLGRLTVAQWRLLAAAGQGLRVTPWRGLIVPGLTAGAARELLAAAGAAGLVTSADSPWHRVGACTGRPGCAKALADVRADAEALVSQGRHRHELPLYFSGCARRCGHPQGPYVDKVATGEGAYTTTAPSPAPT
ncbi:precorrin-3B synthase, partial [Streptomyces sp. 8L]|nr:precorrin-3B synthase [Streptomyces sp. 8L]